MYHFNQAEWGKCMMKSNLFSIALDMNKKKEAKSGDKNIHFINQNFQRKNRKEQKFRLYLFQFKLIRNRRA